MPNEPVAATSQPGHEPDAEVVAARAAASASVLTDLIAVAGLPAEVSGDLREASTHLRQMIADGKAYRATVIEDALLEGVRLMGDGFDKEGTRSLFDRAGVEHIRMMAEQWKAGADRVFPAGRQTLDEAPVEQPEERTAPAASPIPDAAYFG